jgi:SAM-dependent methyltransferase
VVERALRIAQELQRRGLLRFLPLGLLRHHVYPLFAGRGASAYDARTFFKDWYARAPGGEFSDGITISPRYDPLASRFHYAAVELSILRCFWRRPDFRPRSVLDIGTGAGHWIEFYRSVFRPERVTGIDLTPAVVETLAERYRQTPGVRLEAADIASPDLDLGQRFDLVNAIGVMFHIVDDASWEIALANIAAHLNPGGVVLIGGQFGPTTRNVQFSRADDGRKLCNKRIRSRRRWRRAAANAGLRFERVIRTTAQRGLVTPENNVLLLSRTGSR